MSLGAYESEVGRGSVLNALAHPTVANPVAAMGQGVQLASNVTALRQAQFNLQQAQLAPVGQQMRILAATNPDPSEDQFNAALGAAARNGGNVDSTVANYTAWKALNPNGKPGDYMRAVATTGMSPENQFQATVGPMEQVETPQGILFGRVGGAASTTPGQFQLGTAIAKGLSPEQWATPTQVYDPTTKTYRMQPFGQAYGYPAPAGLGGGTGGGTATGGGPPAAPAGPPPGSSVPPGQPLSQKDADLATFAQRESGNQNILSRVPVPPGYTQNQAGSGYYQIIPSTWAEGQQLAGIPPQQRTQMAMQASPQQQYAVASALYDKYGGRPWAQSAPQGGGAVAAAPPGSTVAAGPGGAQSGPFIGTASAQPVGPGGVVAQPGAGAGANVRPAGGPTYLDSMGRPIVQGGAPGGGPGRSLPLPAPGQIQSLETAADASSKQYAADNTDAGQFQRRMWPLMNAEHILETNAPTTGQGAEAVRSIIGHLQTFGNIFTGGDITNIGQSRFEELGKYMQQVVNSSPFAASSNDKLAAAITGSPNTHMTNLANQDVLKAMIAQERMKQLAITDFNNQGGQPMDWSNFLRQWQTTHDLRAGLIDMLSQDKRAQLVKSMTPTERTNFQNTLTLLRSNPGVMSSAAMP